MFDNAFTLPALLMIVPATGGFVAMTMLTRGAAAIVSLLTFLIQAMLLVIGAVQLDRFQGGGAAPSCDNSMAGQDAAFALAKCADWFPRWGIEFNVSLGWAALGLIAMTTLVTAAACAFTWWADRERPAGMHGLMWLTAASLTGLFVARDLVLFYVFFELMLVPLLLLVGVWGGALRIRATMTMFIYTLLGSLPMLVGVLVVGMSANDALATDAAREAGLSASSPFALDTLATLAASDMLSLSSWALVAFLLAFAIKAPLLPFHGWLPIAYREAPAEVTALLSGLVSKAAYFGFAVIVLPLFPSQLGGGWGTALAWIALAGLLYGSLAAFRQPDMRGVVAYSSLAQMGLIVLGLTAFTGAGAQQGLAGSYLQAINHGLVSAAFFLLIGVIELRSGETHFARLGGLATGRARLASVGLVLTLIMLAVPGASTFAGELLILAGVFRGEIAGPLVATLGAAAIVLAAMYALRLIAGIAFTTGDSEDGGVAASTRFGADIGARELLIVGPLMLALLVLSAWPNLLHRAMNEQPVPVAVAADPLVAAPAAAEEAE